MKERILFVDDEQQILDGFRLSLRPKRKEWDLFFALSGHQALELLEREPMQIVVADMRMPGMDGAALLEEIQRRWPGTLRVILSGYSEQQAVMRAVRPAHQYLTKPCDSHQLIATLARTLSLRELLTDEALRECVGKADSLPGLPRIYTEILNELAKPEPSLGRLGGIIELDAGISASLLKTVNSSFFGFFGKVNSPKRAVTLLGTETLKSLVLGVHLFSSFEPKQCEGFSLGHVWSHSHRVAELARAIAKLESDDGEFADTCFSAGLLHDAGKLLLVQEMWGEYQRVVADARAGALPLFRAERGVLGVDHAAVGAYLLGLWGLSESVVWGVLRHHAPQDDPCGEFSTALCAHVADALDHELSGETGPGAPVLLDAALLEARGLADRLEMWRERGRELRKNA